MDEGNVLNVDRFAMIVHENASRSISQFDGKAYTLFGIAGGALLYSWLELSGGESVQTALDLIRGDGEGLPAVVRASSIALILGMMSLGVAAALCLSCIWPRSGPKKGGLVYFGAVARHKSSDAYIQAVQSSSRDQFLASVLSDAFQVSKIAAAKAALVGPASLLLVLGLTNICISAIVQNWIIQLQAG